MSDKKPDSANQCVCCGSEMTRTDTEDYIVFDRTGTPHVVVAVKTEIGGDCRRDGKKEKENAVE